MIRDPFQRVSSSHIVRCMRILCSIAIVGSLVLMTSITGCRKQKSAASVCSVLKVKKIADNCTAIPADAASGAKEIARFDILTEKGEKFGKQGLVLSFDSKEKMDTAFDTLQKEKPNSYVKGRSEKDLWFVMLDTNDGAVGRVMTSFLSGDD